MRVFIVTTPYHLIVACALKMENDYLIIEETDWTKKHFTEELIKKYFRNKYISIWSYRDIFASPFSARKKFKDIKEKLQSMTNTVPSKIFYFNDADPVVQFILNCATIQTEPVLLEEGIGLYNDMNHRYKIIKKILGKIVLGDWYECINRIGEYKKTKCIIAKTPKKLNDLQLSKNVICNSYSDVDTFINSYNLKRSYEVLFVGQPLVEDGQCTMKQYLDIIKKCDEIAKENGLSFCVKTHPREDCKKYNKIKVNFENNEIPIELLISKNEKNVLMTISSSAILNYTNNKNKTLCVLYPILNIKLNEKIFDDQSIYIIRTWNCLINVLGEYVKND